VLQPEHERAKDVLSEAVKVDSGEWIRIIQRAYPDNPKKWDELLQILEGYSRASRAIPEWTGGTTFGNLVPELAAVPALAPPHPTMLLTVGATYGPYRVIRRLTPGGMGEVAIAEDIRLPRSVVLKCLSGSWLESPLARQRLLREARTAAALNHRNIATLYDVLDDDEHPLLVMEYVEGRTLHEILKEGAVPIGLALRYAIQITDAVEYAHDRGIIHCDIKPANIQITPAGIAKVLDFGLARALFEPGDEVSVSERGRVVGTPGYMPPERLTRGTLNAAGDVYALGVVLFELLTGGEPYTERGHALMLAVLASDAPAPSKLVPSLPPALDQIVARAMARDPILRYRSARELGADLAKVLTAIDNRISGVADIELEKPRRDATFWTLAGLSAIPALLAVLTIIGFATLIIYNSPLGLTGEFQPESPLWWPVKGMEVLLAPAFVAAVVGVFGVFVSFLYRLATFGPLGRWLSRPISLGRRLFGRLRSQPTAVLAPAILVIQVALIATAFWRFQPLFEGLDSFISRRLPADLSSLRPENRPEHNWMTQAFSLQVVVFTILWCRMLMHRSRRVEREGLAVIVAGFAVTVFTLLAGQVFPRHILYHGKAERVTYQSRICYLVGQNGPDGLLFCPHQPPPWNEIVKLDSPFLRREGVVESIFTGVGGAIVEK
jgi:serine/threonine protein kinase